MRRGSGRDGRVGEEEMGGGESCSPRLSGPPMADKLCFACFFCFHLGSVPLLLLLSAPRPLVPSFSLAFVSSSPLPRTSLSYLYILSLAFSSRRYFTCIALSLH